MERTKQFRQKTRSDSIRQYFYGPKNDLCPHTRVMNWNKVVIYRVGGGLKAPLSALPIGAESSHDPVRLVAITPSLEIVHSIAAISYSDDPAKLLDDNIAGFLYM
jgi:polyribonucleotide 5'-hydroxyl-kinase